MQLGLAGRGLDAQLVQHRVQLRDGQVGNTDVPHQPLVHQRLDLAVGVHKFRHRERLAVGVAGIHVAEGGVVVREGPVDEQHVQIIALQVRDGLLAGLGHMPVHVVPYLRHDEQLLALHHALVKGPLEFDADLVLVAVAGGAVKQPVAHADAAGHRRRHLVRGHPVRTEGAHADAGDGAAVVQFKGRNGLGIDHGFSLRMILS